MISKLRMMAWSGVLFASAVAGCDLIGTTEQVATATDDLTYNTSQSVGPWYQAGNRIPVCVRGDQATDDNVRRARSILLRTWQEVANVRFDEWNTCPTSGTAKKVVFWLHSTTDTSAGAQANAGTSSLRTPGTDPTGWSVHETFPIVPASYGRQKYLAAHEFGHILTFSHEMDNPENTSLGLNADCLGEFARDGGFVYPDTAALSGYDRDSVMNYCNMYGNSQGYVSGRDVSGARRLFGPALSRVGDINLDGRADVIVRSPTHLTVMSSVSNMFVQFDTAMYYTTLQGGWFLDKMDHVVTMSNLIDNAAAEIVVQSVWGLGVLNHSVDRLGTVGGMAFGTRLSDLWTMDGNQVLAGAGDFNGDGRNELVFHGSNGLAIVGIDRVGTGAAFVLKGFTPNNGSAGGWIVGGNDVIDGIGDFDGDGRDELLIHSSWGMGTIKLATTGTSLALANWHQHGASMVGGWDLDTRDTFMILRNAVTMGRDTIVIRSQWGMGILGIGAPAASTSFYSYAMFPWGTQFVNGTSVYTSNVNDAVLNASDFDGDGRDDLFLRGINGSMVYVGVSGAGFSLIRRHTGTEISGWLLGIDTTFSGYGDFNGDGRAEVIVRNDAGLGRFQLETGTPTIRSSTPTNTQLGVSGFMNIPGVEIPGW